MIYLSMKIKGKIQVANSLSLYFHIVFEDGASESTVDTVKLDLAYLNLSAFEFHNFTTSFVPRIKKKESLN